MYETPVRPLASSMAEVSAVSAESAWGVPVMVGRPVGAESGSRTTATSSSSMVPVATASPRVAHTGEDRVRVNVSLSSTTVSSVTGTVMVPARIHGRMRLPVWVHL